ncbi:MAG: restriction endonuclease subunit S [Pseudohongiella sp.]
MVSDLYETLPLEQLVTVHDKARKPITKSDRKPGPYPYYGASGITDYVNDYIFDGDYVLLAEDGDNLRTRNTPIAFMAKGKFWVNNHAHVFKAKEGESSDYICYALQVADIASYISGSTRPKITQADMRKIPVSAPPLETRETIALVLGSLDNKIQLNRQTNETLEQMAQALFKSWFVDFDPVIDNALEAGNTIPDELQDRAERRQQQLAKPDHQPLPEDIRQLFPSEFELTEEMGWVPMGWEEIKSGEVIDVRDGTHDSPQKSEHGFPLVTSRHITSGTLKLGDTYLISEEDYTAVNKRSAVETGDILLTMIGTVGIPYLVLETPVLFAIKNVGLFRTSVAPKLASYLYQLLLSPMMQNYLEARMAGTTQKYLSLKVLRNLEMILPEDQILDEYNNITSALNSKIKSNLESIATLEKLRDTLLPKLISGELRLPSDALSDAGQEPADATS